MALNAQMVTAQVAKVTLSHNGQLTMYNADNLSLAISASVNGDTIFLNEGTFAGGIYISKAISLIGAGENTIIDGSVDITYSGTLTARMLDALNITGSISAGSSSGLIIRKCKFQSFSCSSLTNALIDRCYCSSTFSLNSGIKNMQVVNSVIDRPTGKASNVGDVVFVNCNILSTYYANYVKATFINSIVRNGYIHRQIRISRIVAYIKTTVRTPCRIVQREHLVGVTPIFIVQGKLVLMGRPLVLQVELRRLRLCQVILR